MIFCINKLLVTVFKTSVWIEHVFFFFRFSVLKLFDFLFYILDIGIIGFLSSLIYFGVKYLQQQNLSEDGFVDKY